MGRLGAGPSGRGEEVNAEFKLVLDDSNSRIYRPRPGLPKKCQIRWEAAEYSLTWGAQQFHGPHIVVLDCAGHYGVDLEVFFSTHRAIPEQPHHYFKCVKVRALLLVEAVLLRTQIKGETEMLALVPAGNYIVQNPAGDRYSNTAAEFERRYELDE